MMVNFLHWFYVVSVVLTVAAIFDDSRDARTKYTYVSFVGSLFVCFLPIFNTIVFVLYVFHKYEFDINKFFDKLHQPVFWSKNKTNKQ